MARAHWVGGNLVPVCLRGELLLLRASASARLGCNHTHTQPGLLQVTSYCAWAAKGSGSVLLLPPEIERIRCCERRQGPARPLDVYGSRRQELLPQSLLGTALNWASQAVNHDDDGFVLAQLNETQKA
jgi:hypothetical protein